MDYDKEIANLAGETLALQTLLSGMCGALLATDPSMHARLASVFDNAASMLEDQAIRYGPAASPHHLVHAVRVVEDLRRGILGDPRQPERGV